MVKKILVPSLVFSIVYAFGSALADPELNPGKWEMTTETEMVGMPVQIPPVTHTQCLTSDDLVPRSNETGKECEVSDVKISGNTVSWKMVCSGENGPMEGTGQATYRGDHMEGVMNMVISGAGMQITNKISGRRIGDCD
ncbi:MAG: DUF3617 family protein [Desulfatiglandaceae bacterium]